MYDVGYLIQKMEVPVIHNKSLLGLCILNQMSQERKINISFHHFEWQEEL